VCVCVVCGFACCTVGTVEGLWQGEAGSPAARATGRASVCGSLVGGRSCPPPPLPLWTAGTCGTVVCAGGQCVARTLRALLSLRNISHITAAAGSDTNHLLPSNPSSGRTLVLLKSADWCTSTSDNTKAKSLSLLMLWTKTE
jgi:hypothetical protein